jgi:hypothetical protein
MLKVIERVYVNNDLYNAMVKNREALKKKENFKFNLKE